MKKRIKDLPSSVHARLQNIALTRGRPFLEIFYYYATERFLYRLSKSEFAEDFVLKGGLAFQGWGLPLRRPTRDIDMQGYADNSIENLIRIVKDVCNQEVEPDGLVFDIKSVLGEPTMEDADYPGVRVYFQVYSGSTTTRLHIDFSFANVITPKEMRIEYPTLLGNPRFSMRGYPPETTIAEKCEAMVKLGVVNDRMKDFFDVWFLSQQKEFSGKTLSQAFLATFRNRNTPLPFDLPEAFSEHFVEIKKTTWNAFIKRSKMESEGVPELDEVIHVLNMFLWPPLKAAAAGQTFSQNWVPRGPWKETSE